MTAVSSTRCLWYYVPVVPDTLLSWKSSQRVKTWGARQFSESELTVYSTRLRQQNGDKRVITLHLWMPDSNPAMWPAPPSSRCPPIVHNTPLSQQRVWNLSLRLKRGVRWGAALVSHPWQGTASRWGHEHPVTHPLQHSMLELCGWSSK